MASSIPNDVPQHVNSAKPHSHDSSASPPPSLQHNANSSIHDKKMVYDGCAGHNSLLQSDALYQYILETSVYPRESPYQMELWEITEKHPDPMAYLGGVGHKSLLQSDALYQYILETSVYPRESPYQTELREITEKHPLSLMAIPPDEGQFLMLLMKLINAKNTMELGVYTGYSLLSTALALPDDGKIIAMDRNRENYDLGAPVIEKAGLSHKVDFREGLILPQLDEMLLEERNLGFFDFVFVDADKDNYVNYHERLLKLVKVGGVIGYDNTLWCGSLGAPEGAPYPEWVRDTRPFILELNRVLAGDERIEISQVALGDGITLCRRIK